MHPPQIELPDTIAVMVLSGCNLLPHGLLPLNIFEPRYRQMLADALDGDRMFSIGTVDSANSSDPEEPEVFDVSCAGLIRACVGQPDGTSGLVLQGIHRIRFLEWVEEPGKLYRIARIAPFETTDHDPLASAALAKRAMELARELGVAGLAAPSDEALAEIEAVTEIEFKADLLGYQLIHDPGRRQQFLTIPDLSDRLRFIIDKLANVGPSFP